MALPNPLEAFVWGPGGAQMTPEQIARQREIADALLNQAGDTSPVAHWTQGAARVANALAGKFKEARANKAEASNAEGSQSRIAALLGGMTGGGAAEFPAAPSGGGGAPVATATIPQSAEAGVIRQGLINRGLPEHVADAFVLNFQDESGLNPGINEANPTVPGSRGGYGLYQLTGPRRVAYEQFAGQRGVDPSDTDAQLDFLMTELQGPESKAAQSILSAPDTGTAAAAIVNNFLRPAPEHRTSRANRYLALNGQGGGTPPAVAANNALATGQPIQVASNDPSIGLAQAAGASPDQQFQPGQPASSTDAGNRVVQALINPQSMTGGAPMPMQGGTPPPAPQEVAQAAPVQSPGMNPGMQAAIAQALSNPGASEGEKQIAGLLLKQQFAQMDPANALDMEYKRAQIAKLTDPNARDKFGNSVIWGQDPDGKWVAMQPSSGGGLVPAITPDGITLSPPGISNLDLGNQFGVRDRAGNVINTVDKNLAAAEADKASGKAQGEAAFDLPRVEQNAEQTLGILNRMETHPGREGSTGFIQGMLPSRSSDQVDFQSLVDQTQGQAFLQAFQMLKGGGQITEIEGQKATDAISRLRNQRLGDKDYLQAIEDLKGVINAGLARARRQAGQGSATPDATPSAPKRLKFNPATGELE